VSRKRARAYRLGHGAEWLAALLLMAKGYRLLARRYRTPLGEIDLVMRRGRTIAFVEVKARPTLQAAFDAVGPAAERRLNGAADIWLARHPDAASFDLRFDMVVVRPWRLPRHVANAFPGRR
jgi:putative endonuclease